MGKLVTVPYLAAITVEIEDETLSRNELVDLAIQAANCVGFKVDNKEIEGYLGEGVSVDTYIEAQAYEYIANGNYYMGHICDVSIEDGW